MRIGRVLMFMMYPQFCLFGFDDEDDAKLTDVKRWFSL